MKRILMFVTALLTIGLASTAARADSIIVTLDTPVQSVVAGETVAYFTGTITTDPGNTGPVYFNFDSFTIDSPLTLDDYGLFVFFPYPMYPGESYDALLFTIYLPGNEAAGMYLGSFSIIGGIDGDAQDTLGTVNFEIDNLGGGISSTPEPSSLLLCGTGLLSLAAGGLKKWRKA